jgi:hypothetical protein
MELSPCELRQLLIHRSLARPETIKKALTLALGKAIGTMHKKLVHAWLERDTPIMFISDNGGPTMPGTAISSRIRTVEGTPGRTRHGYLPPAADRRRPGHDRRCTTGGDDR